jgi:hypothetical protein
VNKDKFGRVAKDGLVDGGIGLDCLIELYRRCAEAIRPLLRMVSEAVATAEGKEHPDRSLGLNKRVELIHKSGYSDLVDCLDPRIRHAAWHAGVLYDKDRGVVKFEGANAGGFADFELS